MVRIITRGEAANGRSFGPFGFADGSGYRIELLQECFAFLLDRLLNRLLSRRSREFRFAGACSAGGQRDNRWNALFSLTARASFEIRRIV